MDPDARPPPVTAIVLAGGSGLRVGAAANKVHLHIAGRPLLAWTLDAIAALPGLARAVLVARRAEEPLAAAIAREHDFPVQIVAGGPTRHASEAAALRALRAGNLLAAGELLAIHDGARPCPSPALLAALVAAAQEYGGAVPGVPVTAPLLEVDPVTGAAVRRTGRFIRIQTPQVFSADAVVAAYAAAERDGFEGTDTSACVARYTSIRICCVDSDDTNLKVTRAEDFVRAARLLRR